MAYTKTWVFTLLMMAFLGGSMGAQLYQVGDSAGWNSQGTDYKLWASGIKFKVGDAIVFYYNPQIHNVLQVTKEDFVACSATAPLGTYTGGSDSIELYASGTYYFICGFPGMCQDGGQKVEIKVSSAKGSNPTLPPFTNPTPPAGNYLPGRGQPGVDCGASSQLSLHNHLILLMLASCVLAFYLH
ncbi:hypothetical protein BUALT_Bualt14G0044500 [Buddleja alternifolia]|uniref:Phytocyanin domain-containing protein n=1 Tax=Buddleja alternifolia TaxID=168488 RepID=A0AAV6WGK1_9LAMI|nr:hypothetical protein BUALT_Bualt14G0044500 [Buddleja alternifolia]